MIKEIEEYDDVLSEKKNKVYGINVNVNIYIIGYKWKRIIIFYLCIFIVSYVEKWFR